MDYSARKFVLIGTFNNNFIQTQEKAAKFFALTAHRRDFLFTINVCVTDSSRQILVNAHQLFFVVMMLLMHKSISSLYFMMMMM